LLNKLPGGRIAGASTLLIADLDHFKSINDTFGHSSGDVALKTFVSRVRELLRNSEHIVRLGGEEFAIILATGDLQEASLRAEQIRKRIASEPVVWDGRTMPVTASGHRSGR